MRAALASRASVLHVVGFSCPVNRQFPGVEIIEMKVSPEGLQGLSDYLHESVARAGDQAASPLGAGFYEHSRFYPARGIFSLSNTCNTWTANALRAAGYRISPANTAEAVMAQARRLGGAIQSPAHR